MRWVSTPRETIASPSAIDTAMPSSSGDDEIVLDMNKHHVNYMVLSYGSWFTGGNKLFAMPLSSLTLNHANNKTFFTAHVSQDTLKNAPGFEKDRWPTDPNYFKTIDTYYERTAARPTTRQ